MASSFEKISEKIEDYEDKKTMMIIPASDNYYGFIT